MFLLYIFPYFYVYFSFLAIDNTFSPCYNPKQYINTPMKPSEFFRKTEGEGNSGESRGFKLNGCRRCKAKAESLRQKDRVNINA